MKSKILKDILDKFDDNAVGSKDSIMRKKSESFNDESADFDASKTSASPKKKATFKSEIITNENYYDELNADFDKSESDYEIDMDDPNAPDVEEKIFSTFANKLSMKYQTSARFKPKGGKVNYYNADEFSESSEESQIDDIIELDELHASINQYKLKFLSSVKGMREFQEFLKPTSGDRLLRFWLDCEFYRDSMQG